MRRSRSRAPSIRRRAVRSTSSARACCRTRPCSPCSAACRCRCHSSWHASCPKSYGRRSSSARHRASSISCCISASPMARRPSASSASRRGSRSSARSSISSASRPRTERRTSQGPKRRPMTDEPDDEPMIHDPAEDDDWYGDADPRVPDAATAWPTNDNGDLDFLGHRDGGYVPSDQVEREAELRELERRLEQNRSPAFPIDVRKHLPLEAVWRRWRSLAMWGRSDVVDDFGRDPRATARWEWLFEFLYSKWFRVE